MSEAAGEEAPAGERTTVNKTAAKEMYCLSEKDVSSLPGKTCLHPFKGA